MDTKVIEPTETYKPDVSQLPDTKHFKLLQTPRYKWMMLGDDISKKEHTSTMAVPYNKFITLRLDGNGFRTKMDTLRNTHSIQRHGFSPEFHRIMVTGLQSLCTYTGAAMGYTQSDEMTLVLASYENKESSHLWGGKRDKLISLTASFLSVCITCEIHRQLSNVPENFVVQFDCRLAMHDTWTEALQVILWRSYDGVVNGISDTVYQCGIDGRKAIAKLHSSSKIKWLQEHKLWPPPQERLFGTVLRRESVVKPAINELTNEPVICERHILVPQPRKEFCMDDFIK